MTQPSLDVAQGEMFKQQGQDAIESTDKSFVATMRLVALAFSQRDGFVSTDELRFYAVGQGLYPKHQNSWGTIFRGPHWKEVGRKRSAIEGNHAREIRIWRWES